MNQYSGSSFDDFLEEDGVLEEVTAQALKRLRVMQITEIMAAGSLTIPEREFELLRLIGEGLPDDIQDRYDFLQKKLLSEQMTPEENQELVGLIDVVEAADADRLKQLIELSQLRQITIDELMAQLGIQPPQLTASQEKLSDFFRNSPLADVELDLSRDKSLPALMDEMSDNVRERGLTPEILDAKLTQQSL